MTAEVVARLEESFNMTPIDREGDDTSDLEELDEMVHQLMAMIVEKRMMERRRKRLASEGKPSP